ncbi:hypothetical protein NG99_19740 [Erwinia typographi]|uniref:Lipoprotein n=1 Tax=Erwinia typographi TaxID=371042 RepID=A0A0A3ZUC4_9GAMM|nr:YaeF family permuted papain-like enzyme [Erwinia typographi]KGT89243.1 hypothetical protein NG99_19740 [Erwinia typographi]
MKQVIVMLLALIAAGCSTDISTHSKPQIVVQSPRTSSAKSVKMIDISSLRAGDILLSSSTTLTSWGIRLFSFSGVSHASLYIGNHQVAEAVGGGVKIISLAEAIAESNNFLALRRNNLSEEQTQIVRDYALAQQGQKYNYKGIVMFAPFMITRRICELPLTNATFRDRCLTMLATVQLSSDVTVASDQPTFFCSEFVLSAFTAAGAPLFSGEAQWMSPGDLLHLRDGDVSAYRTPMKLSYVGHLKRWDLAEILSLRSPEVISATQPQQ